MTFRSNTFFRPILQAERSECGLACLAMICAFYGRRENLGDLRRRFPVSLSGLNLKSVMAIADALDFTSRPVRCELDELAQLQLPCVLHWDLDHFVVLARRRGRTLEVFDPAYGLKAFCPDELSRHFTGVALELTPSAAFQKKKVASRVQLADLWTRVSGLGTILAQLFALTLVMQAFGLVMPIANQIVVDDVIGRDDYYLLMSVVVGFGLITIIQTVVELLRSYIQLYAAQRLYSQFSGNILRHLLRLPTDFFERRHVGDILARYGSLGPIQDFLAGGFIGVLMDSIMIVPAAIIMIAYSYSLSLLLIVDLCVIFAAQWLTFERNRRFTDELITHSGNTQSVFLETIRAVRAIKLAGRESERHALWNNALTEQQNVNFRQSTFNMWGGAGYKLVLGAQALLMLYFGAMQIMSGHMTLGMFMAFQAYAVQFSTRARSIVTQVFAYKTLDLHLERIGDIVHADPESHLEGSMPVSTITGEIEVRDIDFRYAPQDPFVFRDVTFKILPGERIALTGPSGGGKSTLLKILTGLYGATSGQILINGSPLGAIGLRSYREHIGVVMQDDHLLSGTVADNVAFFDANIDFLRVREACRLACVHDEIERLPMGYHSLIGDMGSILSGLSLIHI